MTNHHQKDGVTTDTADESEVDEEQERGAAEVDETVEQSAEIPTIPTIVQV